MRKNIVAGNWKMNTKLEDGIKLASAVSCLSEKLNNDTGIIISPPYLHLTEIEKVIGNGIGLAAQNCADEASGAYTGEISAEMLASAGVGYVIIGHSERRAIYNEEDETLAKKVKIALENKLTVIFCIGELLKQRESGELFDVIDHQLHVGLYHLGAEKMKDIIIAYEPVWAIGTGVVASPDQAQEMHAYIRKTVTKKYNEEIAQDMTILYGGSCKPGNAKELFANPDVDGGLIGGASLKAEDFIEIVKSF